MSRKIECDRCKRSRPGRYYRVTIIEIEHGKEDKPKEFTIEDCCEACLEILRRTATLKRRGRKPAKKKKTGVAKKKNKTTKKRQPVTVPIGPNETVSFQPPQKPVIPLVEK